MQYALSDDQSTPIPLKDPVLAAILAWLIPGAGHLYQGRTGKGILYMVCILGAFFQGLYLGGGKVVYASMNPEPRLPYICQVWVGLPALPAMVQWYRVEVRHESPVWPNIMVPPAPPHSDMNARYGRRGAWTPETNQVDTSGAVAEGEHSLWERTYGPGFELGTVYTMIAGLLNLLAIFDAFGGPAASNSGESGVKVSKPTGSKTTPTGKS
jgi:hypothetical protein